MHLISVKFAQCTRIPLGAMRIATPSVRSPVVEYKRPFSLRGNMPWRDRPGAEPPIHPQAARPGPPMLMAGAYRQPELHAAFTVEPPHGLGQNGCAARGFEATNFSPSLKFCRSEPAQRLLGCRPNQGKIKINQKNVQMQALVISRSFVDLEGACGHMHLRCGQKVPTAGGKTSSATERQMWKATSVQG